MRERTAKVLEVRRNGIAIAMPGGGVVAGVVSSGGKKATDPKPGSCRLTLAQ